MAIEAKHTEKSTAPAARKRARRRCNSQSPRVARGGTAGRAGKKDSVTQQTVEVAFGDVRVLTPRKTNAAQVKRNIRAGQLALARAKDLIVKPGVTLELLKGVPRYHADPDQPELLVREIDGKRERGKFVDGKFRIVRR